MGMISYKRSRVQMEAFKDFHFIIEYDTRFQPQDVVLACAMTIAYDMIGQGEDYDEEDLLKVAASAVAHTDFKLINRLAKKYSVYEHLTPSYKPEREAKPKEGKPVPFPWIGVSYIAFPIIIVAALVWSLFT